MKLLHLKLGSQFRALHRGFEIFFLRDFDFDKAQDFAPYCLVGRNGSGKSNVLEALAAIFYHVECIYLRNKPDGFDGEGDFAGVHTGGFFPEQCDPDSFELEYLCHKRRSFDSAFSTDFATKFDAHIRIKKELGKAPTIEWINRKEIEPDGDIFLSALEVKDFLPDFIVGYSSGENEVLSLPFFKMRFLQYDEYVSALREQTGYSQPEARLVYIDTQFSQAVLLTNFLMHESEVIEPFYDTIGIKRITQFRIIIGYEKSIPDEVPLFDDFGLVRSSSKVSESFRLVELLEERTESKNTFKALDSLRRCATLAWLDSETGNLYLDYFVDDNDSKQSQLKKAFRAHFNNDPFELFSAFHALLNLNLYDVDRNTKAEVYRSSSLYVKETVPVSASNSRIMRFKDFRLSKSVGGEPILMKGLSDGEHQFLHTIGLCLLFRNSNSLFLLDEPDTHFNPDWRAKFLSTLYNCFKGSDANMVRDVLVTSHSPFVISDSPQENVLVFKADSARQISVSRPGFNTFGASANQITMKVFDRALTIGNYANNMLAMLYERLEKGDDRDELIDLATSMLGDSVERVIFINRALAK